MVVFDCSPASCDLDGSFSRENPCGLPAKPAAAAATKAPAPTADDWHEVQDPSGKSYWWNKRTNETTAVGAAKPGPDPWQEVKDPSGQTYWWNKETNQTTAIGAPKPSAVAPQPEAGVPAAGGLGGGLRGALMDGLAWGVGTSVASRMMDGILGPRQMEVVHRNEDGGAAAGGEATSLALSALLELNLGQEHVVL
ncbi:unnamed protein product [Symbiodinium pilosum]|uniref:WW domain-containing protein n=1 Tax=Symbiodinium pilosum TaxID=2952 RepID=A0A812IQ77_SYMPI|nr:unnamed protein product [Symbiodinium pilosum]